jgi:gliding motility-associated-like protein
MKKQIALILFIFLNIVNSKAQVYLCYGANTFITDSAYVVVQGKLQNDAGGTIGNDGTIILSGNFVNNSSFNSGNVSNVNLTGAIQDVGGSITTKFNNLLIGGTDNKTTSIETKVGGILNFSANKLIIGNNNFDLLTTASIVGDDNDRFVVTNGTGFLKKQEVPIGTDFTFPVGTDIDILNYKPVIVNYSGAIDTFSVRVEPGPSPVVGYTLPECVQYTYIVQEGIPGGNTGALTLGWNHNFTDEGSAFQDAYAKMWQFDGTAWNALPGLYGYLNGTHGTDREYTTQISAITDFSGYKSNFLVKAEGETDIFVPNAFSPNGDGQNDILYFRGNGFKDLDFVIYDRWGEKVFETTDKQVGWDGTYKGVKLSTAVFSYYVKATNYSGTEIEKKGNVTLVR